MARTPPPAMPSGSPNASATASSRSTGRGNSAAGITDFSAVARLAAFLLCCAVTVSVDRRAMRSKLCTVVVSLIALAALATGDGFAQTKVRTETIRPPDAKKTAPPSLAAARSGNLERVVSVMQSNEMMPVFSPSDDKDPLAYWKANYPDSEGLEVLAILAEVLEAPLVHVDKGTPQEMFLWPYFARMQLKDLTAEQKVALFRLVTGSDYRDMLQFGAYNFYR